MRVAVIGQGYVGLTTAACLAEANHQVTGVECAPHSLAMLRRRRAPFFEPGLQELLLTPTVTSNLSFTDTLDSISDPLDAVIITVGSPPLPSGQCDLRQVWTALDQVGRLHRQPRLVILKSTVPPGTSARWLAGPGHPLCARYVYNPEFLSQGTALQNWRQPDRLVVGLSENRLVSPLQELFYSVSTTWLVTDLTSAETIKYSSNAFLALKISFANEMANLCEGVGSNVDDVIRGTGLDRRIGADFLRVGIGYGDSCLPKDTQALAYWARSTGHRMPLLHATIEVNEAQRLKIFCIVQEHFDQTLTGHIKPTVAVLGLQYEPFSDDVREAPSRTLVPGLQTLGAQVKVWDPGLRDSAVGDLFPGVEHCVNIVDAVRGASAAIVLTEWPQVRDADWAQLAGLMTQTGMVIDAKNWLLPADIMAHGLRYRGIGRNLQLPRDITNLMKSA
jgi:UDPglucose 6-dehydrogenase